MSLKKLNTSQLDQRIKSLFKSELEVLHDILLTIKEIDQRRMYLDLGHSSLFDYLTQNVGYPNGSAQRRIDAARLLADVPSAGEKILSGELNLSQITMIQKASREVFQATSKKVSSEHKKELIEQISQKDHRESEIQVAAFFDLPVVEKTKVETQSDESVRVALTLSKELYEKIEQAQALLSHALGNKDLVSYLEYVTNRVIKQKTSVRPSKNPLPDGSDKSNQSSSAKASAQSKSALPRASASPSARRAPSQADCTSLASHPARGNAFSARTKKILLKQHLSCQFKDPGTQKICGSRWFLQVDHKQSQWAGGDSELKNAQVLCGVHNRRKYQKEARINRI